MCTCLYCVFVSFRLCVFILICFICTTVRTTATELKLSCSELLLLLLLLLLKLLFLRGVSANDNSRYQGELRHKGAFDA